MMVGGDLGRVIDLLLVKILNPMNLHKTYNGWARQDTENPIAFRIVKPFYAANLVLS